jgi:hypothetical protein
MIVFRPTNSQLKKRHANWKTVRDSWLQVVQKDKEYYYNDVEGTRTLFTQAQLDNIEEETDIPLAINNVFSSLHHELALLTHVTPSHKVIAVDGEPVYMVLAEAIDRMKHSALINSNALLQREEMIKDYLLTGMMVGEVRKDKYYSYGETSSYVSYVAPEEIILDVNCRDRNLERMSGYFTEKEVTLEEAENEYGYVLEYINAKYKKQLQKKGLFPLTMKFFATSAASKSKNKIVQTEQGYVTIAKYYTKTLTKLYYYTNSDGVLMRDFLENIDDELQTTTMLEADEWEKNLFVKYTLMFGDWEVLEMVEPLTRYPHQIEVFEWNGSPYKTYGMVHFIRDLIDSQSKLIQQMVLNGVLTNNAGWIYPQGSIAPQDIPKWKSADPRQPKPYKPVPMEGQVLKPEREQIGQLSNFFPQILSYITQAIRDTTGMSPYLTGQLDGPSNEPFSAIKQFQNAAMERVLMAIRHVNNHSMYLGFPLVEYLLTELKPDQVYTILRPDGGLGSQKFTTEEINLLKKARFKLIPLPTEALPTQKLASAQEMFKIAQSTPDPVERTVFIEEALRLSGDRSVDALLNKIEVVQQLSQKNKAQEESINRLVEINKQLENRYIRSQADLMVSEEVVQVLKKLAKAEQGALDNVKIKQLEDYIKELRSASVSTETT